MIKALFHTTLTVLTGGLWLVYLLIRYMQSH
jgi:hypothetical protein